MTTIHNCLLSTCIERTIFNKMNSIENKELVPNDNCSICLEPLIESAKNSCCGNYSKQFLKCQHWCHVSCQIDKNILTRHMCSLCKTEQVDKDWLDDKIKNYNKNKRN